MLCDELELSAYLDGEAEDATVVRQHLEECAECRAIEADLRRLRSQLRYETDLDGPDVTAAVLAGLPVAVGRARRRRQWRATAVTAAAACAVGIVGGSVLTVVRDDRPQRAAASSLEEELDRAQLVVAPFRAAVALTQRDAFGAVTSASGELLYLGPERLMLEVAGASTANTVVIDDASAWRSARTSDEVDQTTFFGDLAPFGSLSQTMLDLVVPVRGLDRWSGQVTERVVDGRRVLELEGTGGQFATLASALRLAGVREIHPTDRVVVQLDASTYLLAGIQVIVGSSDLRAYDDERQGRTPELPGTLIVDLELGAPTSVAPATPLPIAPVGATARSEGFTDGPVAGFTVAAVLPNGLPLHRTGTQRVGADELSVASWGQGRAWVRVVAIRDHDDQRPFGIGAARPVRLGAGTVYADVGGSVGVHTEDVDLVVTGTVAPEELLAVVETLGVIGLAVPGQDESPPFTGALVVAVSLDASATTITIENGSVVVTELAGPGETRWTITQRQRTRLDPPTDPAMVGVQVRGREGRYSVRSGELEWVEHGVGVVVAGSSPSLEELLAVADLLEASR